MKAFFKWLATKNSRTTKCIFIFYRPACNTYLYYFLSSCCFAITLFILDNHTCYCSCGNSQCQNSHWKIFLTVSQEKQHCHSNYLYNSNDSIYYLHTFCLLLLCIFLLTKYCPYYIISCKYNRKNHHNPMDDTVIFSRRICRQRNCFIF